IKGFPQHGGKRCPCRDDGGGEIARFFSRSQSERLRLQNLFPGVVFRHHAGGRALPRGEQWGREGGVRRDWHRKPELENNIGGKADIGSDCRGQSCGCFGGSLCAISGHSLSTTARISSEIRSMCSIPSMYL